MFGDESNNKLWGTNIIMWVIKKLQISNIETTLFLGFLFFKSFVFNRRLHKQFRYSQVQKYNKSG